MAKISKTRSSAPKAPKKSAPPKKAAPAKKPEARKAGDTKPEENKKNSTTTEDGKAKKNDESKETDAAKEADKNDPAKESSDEKKTDTEDKFEESKELKEDKEGEEGLSEELKGLKDALAALYDSLGEEEQEQKAEEPSNVGGCCGKKSGKSEDSQDSGPKDWNKVLAAGIAAVKMQQLAGGAQGQPGAGNPFAAPGMNGANRNGANQAVGGMRGPRGARGAQGMMRPGGARGANGANPMMRGGQNNQGQNPLQKLRMDYDKAKSSGAELKPEIEREARQLLGLPPLDNGQQGRQVPGAMGMAPMI